MLPGSEHSHTGTSAAYSCYAVHVNRQVGLLPSVYPIELRQALFFAHSIRKQWEYTRNLWHSIQYHHRLNTLGWRTPRQLRPKDDKSFSRLFNEGALAHELPRIRSMRSQLMQFRLRDENSSEHPLRTPCLALTQPCYGRCPLWLLRRAHDPRALLLGLPPLVPEGWQYAAV